MAVVASGVETLTLEAVRVALSESATFQAWVGATGSAIEKAAIAYARAYEIETDAYTAPCALIDVGSFTVESISTGGGGRHDGSIAIMFLMTIDVDDDAGEACRRLINQTGAIMQDMLNHSTLAVVSLERDGQPQRTSEDEEDAGNREYAARYIVNVWGMA